MESCGAHSNAPHSGGIFKMAHMRADKVSVAQQYQYLSESRRDHVNQLIKEQRRIASWAEWSRVFGNERDRESHSSIRSPERQTCIASTEFEIPGRLRGRSMKALGDTGARRNFISEKYANDLRLPIDRNIIRNVIIGSGKHIRTVGMTTAPFRFQDEQRVYDLHFHVFPGLIHDVILGKPFLKLTETLTKLSNFCRRVKERVNGSRSKSDLLYVGTSSYMFQGSINNHSQTALADSGAKVLVMDEAYARSIGLTILTGPEHITRLRVADGSTVDTSGTVYDVEWRFGRGDTFTSPYRLDFHILDNAPADVILCDSFLYQHNAFSRYNRYLLDDDDTWDEDEDDFEDDFAVSAIDIDKREKRRTIKSGITRSLANLEFLEIVRRGEEDERIAGLAKNEQASAQSLEGQRRTEWDKTYADLQKDAQPDKLQLHFEDAVARLKPTSLAPFIDTHSGNCVFHRVHQICSFPWHHWHKRGKAKN